MTRDELIKAIYDSNGMRQCPDGYCELVRNCMECAEKQLAEHEAKIRAEAIREYKSKLRTDVCARAQNCYKGMFNEREQEIFNFATKTFLDAMDYFAEQLKEQRNE